MSRQKNSRSAGVRGADAPSEPNLTLPRNGAGAAPGANLRASVSSCRGEGALTIYPALIRNLSNAGVSFVVDTEADRMLRADDYLSLTFTLPTNAAASTIFCHVRHRAPFGSTWIYGCEYDWSATTDPLGIVEDLVALMLERSEDADDPPAFADSRGRPGV